MKTLQLLILALVPITLASCEPAPSVEQLTTLPAPGGIENPPPPPPLRPAPATLTGEWRVLAINGDRLDPQDGITLHGDDEELWWEPRCAGRVQGYVIVGNAITFGRRTSTPPAASSTPAPVCAIGLPRRLHEVTQALNVAEVIETMPDASVRISGGERSLLLRSTR